MPPTPNADPLKFDIDTPEVYRMGLVEIDVRAAKRILAAKKRKPATYPCALDDIARFVRRPESQKRSDGSIAIIASPTQIDWDRIQSSEIDLSVPLLLARLPPELNGLWPIDGWHRIAKAVEIGITCLPCFILSAKDSLRVITWPKD